MTGVSIVEYFSDKSASSCGYCRGRNSSYSHGMWGHVLTCPDYQALIDRGWRRSGRYCYKPTMNQTCCPQYTIKCDATKFIITKSQKKILKKFRNFVLNGETPTATSVNELTPMSPVDSDNEDDDDDDISEEVSEEENVMDVESVNQDKAESVEGKLKLVNADQVKIQPSSKNKDMSSSSSSSETDKSKLAPSMPTKAPLAKTPPKPGSGADPSKPKAKKKKELRKEKAMAKLLAAGKSPTEIQQQKSAKNAPKTLEALTSCEFPPNAKHKFEVRLVNAQTSDATFNETYLESYNVYKKYQMIIHKEAPSKCTVSQFKRFLCNSSLYQTSDQEGKEFRYGAFHQQYVIDGKIVAVGVVDILPTCISSVYLYYDPDYAFLSPGTLTSLFEIAFTRKLQKESFPNLLYYYMGYYIHSCPKMRYKAKYQPSWLLCPVTFTWIPVRDSLPLLDKAKFSKLSPIGHEIVDAGELIAANLDEVLVLYENQAMPFRLYRSLAKVDGIEINELKEYAGLIGCNLSKSILLYRG